MRNIIILSLTSLFLFACNTTSSKSYEDMPHPHVKHEWVQINKAQRSIFGVNDATSIARGEQLYKQHCKSCHGTAGAGDGEWASDFDIKPANLKNLSGNMPNHYMTIKINEGSNMMPKWKNLLEPQQVWDLTNYIQTLQEKD